MQRALGLNRAIYSVPFTAAYPLPSLPQVAIDAAADAAKGYWDSQQVGGGGQPLKPESAGASSCVIALSACGISLLLPTPPGGPDSQPLVSAASTIATVTDAPLRLVRIYLPLPHVDCSSGC